MEGRTYSLNIDAGGELASSVTSIPYAVALDSLWFRLAQQQPDDDSLGFIYATLTDPDTMGNAYRWFAKRINQDYDGDQKDDQFIAPLFSVFEDRYINALTFDFNFNRGSSQYSSDEDDENEEAGYFKRGDTVVVKFVSIGIPEFQFYNTYANNVASQGDLFSTPANARTNISGGLGVWAGYAQAIDTMVCVP
ncbi:MAG: DUF4249 family protein [Flavobacteriales bacterium]|nr:DUF4249 family protein [Flavobacteriales bacterium]